MPEPEDSASRKTHFGFKANPMDKLFISHGGLSSLCFDRNAFFDEAFDVDEFLSSHTQRGMPLEVLKDDLATYRKILQSALVQLVDREYADFVHLSSSLVGVDKSIEKLRNPVEDHLRHVEKCLTTLTDHIHALNAKILRKRTIEEEKRQLLCLSSAMEWMEKLLEVERLLEQTPPTPLPQTSQTPSTPLRLTPPTSLRLPLLFRISDFLSRIYSAESEIGETVWFLNVKTKLSFVDVNFMKVVGEEIQSAVRAGDASGVQRCCLVYQHLKRLPAAYQVVSEGVVRPALFSVIRDSQLKKTSLEDLLSDVFSVIEERFYSLAYVKQADFILHSVWNTLIGLLTREILAHLAPDQADLFRRNFSVAKNFMKNFVILFSSIRKNFLIDFWKHPATLSFLDKWSFPVYYQVRFMQIAAPVEDAMSKKETVKNVLKKIDLKTNFEKIDSKENLQKTDFENEFKLISSSEISENNLQKIDSENEFKLIVSSETWNAILRCWHPDVCLPELVHRFWKLSLLLTARFISWLKERKEETDSATLIPDMLADIGLFRRSLKGLLSGYVRPVLEEDEKDVETVMAVLSESLDESLRCLKEVEDQLVTQLATQTAEEMNRIMRAVQDTPRLYRRTNRDAPASASSYVDVSFELLVKKLSEEGGLTFEQLRNGCVTCLEQVLTQFSTLVLDQLDSVRRMEDSLKKLRKTRFAADASVGLSDDDKIRLQLFFDVERISQWVQKLGFTIGEFATFASANERVLAEKP